MKTRHLRFFIAFLALSLGAVISQAQSDAAAPPPPPMHGPGGHGFGMGDHMMGFFADYLNLSDAQQSQMKSIMQKEHAAMKPLMEQMRQNEQQLRQYEEGSFDETKVRALAAQQAQTQVELTVAHTRLRNELFQVLNADQQTKMKEVEARHQARVQKRMQQSPPAPPEE